MRNRAGDAGYGMVEATAEIAAPREVVWRAICKEAARWWPADFYTLENARIDIEPEFGGRWVERSKDGSSILWFTVSGFRPGRAFTLEGRISRDCGGPALSQVCLALGDAPDGGTLFKLTDCLVGRVDDKLLASLEEGWSQHFVVALKEYAEAAAKKPAKRSAAPKKRRNPS